MTASPPRCRKQTRLSGAGAASSKSGVLVDPAGELLRQGDVLDAPFLQPLHAVVADHEPQLQRAEPSAQRDLPVAVVDHAPDSVALLRRYSGRMLSVWISAARSATKKQSQSKLVNIHLCGLKQ